MKMCNCISLYCRQERRMTEQGLYVLSPNPVYDVMGEGLSVSVCLLIQQSLTYSHCCLLCRMACTWRDMLFFPTSFQFSRNNRGKILTGVAIRLLSDACVI